MMMKTRHMGEMKTAKNEKPWMNRSQKRWWRSREKSLMSALKWAELRCFAIPAFLCGHHNTRDERASTFCSKQSHHTGYFKIERRNCCFIMQFDKGIFSDAYMSRIHKRRHYWIQIKTKPSLSLELLAIPDAVLRLVIFCIWRHMLW